MQLSTTKQLRVTASFGISCFPTKAISTGDQLVKAADDAMYRAKNEGRNKINLHQPAQLPS
jgi:diguanylate cyclase (GGDEF)-like protein